MAFLPQTLGTMDDIKKFWNGVSSSDPKLQGFDARPREVFMPMVVHADKGPHAKQDSLHVINMYSIPAVDKQLGMENSSLSWLPCPTTAS